MIDKPFWCDLVTSGGTGDRVAKSRDRGCKPDHAASAVASFLNCGTRAPLRTTAPLPFADKLLVGFFGVPGELNLSVA
jgi:hypothetical protein